MGYAFEWDGQLDGVFGAAATVNSAPESDWTNSVETVPVNALQSMDSVSGAGEQSWSGFWQDMLKGVTQYAVQRDVMQMQAQQRPTPYPVTPRPGAGVGVNVGGAGLSLTPGMLILLGLGAYALTRK